MVESSICMNMPTITQVMAMRSASGLSRRGAWKKDSGVVVIVDNSGVPRLQANRKKIKRKPGPGLGKDFVASVAVARAEDFQRFCYLRAQDGRPQHFDLFAQPQQIAHAQIDV